MARKSGLSHGLAAFLSMMVGSLMISYFKSFFPSLIDFLEQTAARAGSWLEGQIGIAPNPDIFVPAFVGFILAFLWGMLYHRIRHGGKI